MDDNRFQYQEDSDSQNTSQGHSTDQYDPYQAYNYERAHTEPERDRRGHPLPPRPEKPNRLSTIAFSASLATIFLCCCSPYASILCGIMGITLAICSKYFNNEERRMHPQAVAAIVISTIALVLVFGSILINYVLMPYLMETSPEFKEYYNKLYEQIMEMLRNGQSGE